MSHLATSMRHQRETSALVEQQIQRWLLLQQAQDRGPRLGSAESAPRTCGHYVAISRQAGAGGEQIARAVSDELDWQMLDRELLALVAKAAGCSPNDVELVDETAMRWVADFFNHWIEHAPVSHEKYAICLSAVMRAAARQGNLVIVGRGSQFLLPRSEGLSVRVIASKSYRIEQVRRLRDMSLKQAREWVERTDRDRREFVEQHYHHDVNDMQLYDLVVNVERLGVQGAARQIAYAARAVFEESSP